MLRNRKATILMLATISVAGCAHSDRPKQRYGEPMWKPASNAKGIEAAKAPSVAILPQTHFAAAKLFESQHLYGKAVTQYRKAIAVDHNFVEAYHRLGLLLSAIGKHEQALDPLARAVQLKPDNTVLRNNYGFELLLNQRWIEAAQQFAHAVELNPDFPRAYINLGIAYSKMGRFDEALASFRRVLPEPDAYYNIGLMYRGQRRYTEAAEVFEYVLRLDPKFAAARTQLQQVAGNREPGTTPAWDRPPSKKVTKASDRADLPQVGPRSALPTAQPPKTRAPGKPTDRPRHGDGQSRAEPEDSMDGTIVRRDHALTRRGTATAGRAGHRTSAQRSERTGRTDLAKEQQELETLLTTVENQTRSLNKTERKPTTVAKRPPGPDKRRAYEPQKNPRRNAGQGMPREIAKRSPALPTRQQVTRLGREHSDRADESFADTDEICYGDPPRLFSTVRELDSAQSTLGTVDELDPYATSCVDIVALMRELEEELTMVRNEIDCIEGDDIGFDEGYTRARGTLPIDPSMFSTGSDLITLPILTTADPDDFVGPPLELARRQGKNTTATKPIRRRARLSSTVIDEKPKTTTKTPADRTRRSKAIKPKKPISRADDWRLRYQDLQDLLEVTRNELVCTGDQTDTDNAWSALLRDTVGDQLSGHATIPLD